MTANTNHRHCLLSVSTHARVWDTALRKAGESIMPGLEAHPGVAGPLAHPPAVAGPSGGVAAASGARTLLLWRVVFGFLGRLRSAEGGPQKLRSRDIASVYTGEELSTNDDQ